MLNNENIYLYHYYEKEKGPFLSLSDISDEDAKKVQDALKEDDNIYVKRDSDGQYMFYRRMIESRMRTIFINKGGKPVRQTPRYLIMGECDYCKSWYKDAEIIKVPLSDIDLNTVSFTYGDSFPTFDPSHGDTSEYRQNVYTYDEINSIIEKYGWPQDIQCNEDTPYWHPRYVEAQLWNDISVEKM